MINIALLNKRREKLIELNEKYDYIRDEKKSVQYLRLLLEIKKRKCKSWAIRRETNKKYSENLERAKNNIAELYDSNLECKTT